MSVAQSQVAKLDPQPLLLREYAALARTGNEKSLRSERVARLFSVEVPNTPFSTLLLVAPIGRIYRTTPSMGRTYRAWRNQEECSETAPKAMNRKLGDYGLSLADFGQDLLGVTYFHGPREFNVWRTEWRVKYFCRSEHLSLLAAALAESMPMIEEWQADEADVEPERAKELTESTFGALFGPLTLFAMAGYGIRSEQFWRDVFSKLPEVDYSENKRQFEDGLRAAIAQLDRAIGEIESSQPGAVAKWRRAATLGTPNISWPGFVRDCSCDLVSEVIELRTRVVELLQVPQLFASLAEREFMDLEEKPNQLDQLKWIAKDAPGSYGDRVLGCVSRLEAVVMGIRGTSPALARDVLSGHEIDASIKQFVAA